VNLAAEGYGIDVYFNGNSNPGTRIDLTGTVAPGDVWVVADDGADSAILAEADQITTRSLWNGDDAVVLRKGGKDDGNSTPTPEELETKLTKLATAIETELRLPEIIVLQEVENTAITQELGDRVNAATGTDYTALSFETSDGRGIEVAFLYDADRVDLLEAFQLSGPDVEAAFGPSSPSPGREPLYGLFEAEGELIHIIGNHFKSKGGDDPIFGIASLNGQPFERITEVQRKAQAQVVRDFVNGIFAEDVDALVMVTGDLNDFQFAEPGEGSDDPVSILEGTTGDVPLTNLVAQEKDAERFSFVFDGNSQVLDHMLVSPSLLPATQAVDFLHFNVSYPASLAGDPTTPLRAADHDPLEGRFRLK
jgi:predicted extracellular nuclease